MWGSNEPWNQWVLQSSNYDNVPHDQIDWAALAKQWIERQQPGPENSEQSQPTLSSSVTLIPSQPQLSTKPFRKPFPNSRDLLCNYGEPNLQKPGPLFMPKKTEYDDFWRDVVCSSPSDDIWTLPPAEAPLPLIPAEKKTFDYGHAHDKPLAMQSVDYDHIAKTYTYDTMFPEDNFDDFWPQGPPLGPVPQRHPRLPFIKKGRDPAPDNEESSQLDAAKRKQLPAWIREGLEKMEQERLKRLEKERAEKEEMENKKKGIEPPIKGLLVSEEYENPDISMPSKSRFDSDSEDEEPPLVPTQQFKPVKEPPSSYVPDTRTDAEKRMDCMLKVKILLTEILLCVTNSELSAIVSDVYQRSVAKSLARPLTTAPVGSIASSLGNLISYDSYSESDVSEQNDNELSSDEELRMLIAEKKRSFAIKERMILDDIKYAEEQRRMQQKKQALEDAYSQMPEDVEPNRDMKPVHSNMEMNTHEISPIDTALNLQDEASLPVIKTLSPQTILLSSTVHLVNLVSDLQDKHSQSKISKSDSSSAFFDSDSSLPSSKGAGRKHKRKSSRRHSGRDKRKDRRRHRRESQDIKYEKSSKDILDQSRSEERKYERSISSHDKRHGRSSSHDRSRSHDRRHARSRSHEKKQAQSRSHEKRHARSRSHDRKHGRSRSNERKNKRSHEHRYSSSHKRSKYNSNNDRNDKHKLSHRNRSITSDSDSDKRHSKTHNHRHNPDNRRRSGSGIKSHQNVWSVSRQDSSGSQTRHQDDEGESNGRSHSRSVSLPKKYQGKSRSGSPERRKI